MLAVAAAAARALDQAEGSGRAVRPGRRTSSSSGPCRINIRPLWLPVITAELADTADGWRTALAELNALPGPAHLPPYAGLRLAQHLVAARERAEAKAVLATADRAGGDAGRAAADRPARRAGPAGRLRRRRPRSRRARWPG